MSGFPCNIWETGSGNLQSVCEPYLSVSPKSAPGQFVQSNQASKIMGARHSAQLKIHFQAAVEVGKIMERDCVLQTVLYLFNCALNFPP